MGMNSQLPPQVRAFLDKHGLRALEFEPGSTPTSVLAAQRIGCEVGQIAKSLLFRDKLGAFHLVLLAGDAKVSSGKMKRLVGSDTSMASPDETLRVTGFRVGGVCPFGVENVPIYLDASLKKWETVYPAAGTDASGVPTSYAQLLKITGARECDVASEPKPAKPSSD
jgi:prolyl-tRNA editing enzyme YbaK/EbsC (Cys-tRNA(Pro) deacylase)